MRLVIVVVDPGLLVVLIIDRSFSGLIRFHLVCVSGKLLGRWALANEATAGKSVAPQAAVELVQVGADTRRCVQNGIDLFGALRYRGVIVEVASLLILLVSITIQFLLEFLQLHLEAGIRIRLRSRSANAQHCRVVRETQLVHEESNAACRGARDAGPTVHEYLAALVNSI